MILNYVVLGIFGAFIISIYSDGVQKAHKDLGFYWVVSLFLVIGAEILGRTELAYFFAGATFFLLAFGDKLKFK